MKVLLQTTLMVILCLFIFGVSYAIDVVGANVKYIEPTLNSDGTPLDDLDHTNVYIDTVKGTNIPATKPTGGGEISVPIDILAPIGTVKVITVSATATDASSNESIHSNTIQIRIDKLAPSGPK